MLKEFRSLSHVEVVVGAAINTTFEVDGLEVNLGNRDWKFGGWIHGDRTLGRVLYRTKEICLNKGLYIANLKKNPTKLVDTMLHEIAHAIHHELLCGHDHGEDWKRIAKQIGCDGKEKYDYYAINHPATKYQLVCNNCDRTTNVARKPTLTHSCGKCAPGKFDERYILTVKQNY